jgi:hypothetical protein
MTNNAHGVILLFDLNDINSFLFIKEYYNEKIVKDKKSILVGTKEDLLINDSEGYKKNEIFIQVNKFVNENKINFVEISSKTGKNVNESILKIVNLCYNKKVLFIILLNFRNMEIIKKDTSKKIKNI